jgi:hypothetical protein
VDKSALLLVVMSPLYLKSTWCTDEIEWFVAAGGEEGPELNRFNRIFVARAFPTDHEKWPGGLKDKLGKATYGHFFHPSSGRAGAGFPFGWPMPTRTVQDYWLQIIRLASEITAKLLRLKEIEQSSAKDTVVTVEPAIGRQVFLGFVHDTLIPARRELRRELTKAGLQVLPPESDDAWDEPSLRERLGSYLQQAHVVALCANQYCGTWPRNQNGGFVSLQVQAARERNIPCQLWLQWDRMADPQSPEYKQFLDELIRQSEESQSDIRLNFANAEEFAGHVKTVVNTEHVSSTGVEQLAVVCANLRADVDTYRRFYDTVITAIGATDRLSILPMCDNTTGHIRLKEIEKDINRADTIVVICFDEAWGWASHVMGQIRQLIKANAAKRVRLLIIGPPAKEGFELNASAFQFTTVNANAIDEEGLRAMLREALRGAGNVAENIGAVQVQ